MIVLNNYDKLVYILEESEEFKKFVSILTEIEENREFDRQVDRLKKSSSAVTVWAVIPGLFGIYGISHFYLNRPLEGLVLLLSGFISSSVFVGGLFPLFGYYPFFSPFANWSLVTGLDASIAIIIFILLRLIFFVVNIIFARYHYSRYDFYIHKKARKPWNNWGLDSMM